MCEKKQYLEYISFSFFYNELMIVFIIFLSTNLGSDHFVLFLQGKVNFYQCDNFNCDILHLKEMIIAGMRDALNS